MSRGTSASVCQFVSSSFATATIPPRADTNHVVKIDCLRLILIIIVQHRSTKYNGWRSRLVKLQFLWSIQSVKVLILHCEEWETKTGKTFWLKSADHIPPDWNDIYQPWVLRSLLWNNIININNRTQTRSVQKDRKMCKYFFSNILPKWQDIYYFKRQLKRVNCEFKMKFINISRELFFTVSSVPWCYVKSLTHDLKTLDRIWMKFEMILF